MSTNTEMAQLAEASLSRRGFFMKLGLLFNGFAAIVLALPVARFLLSSVTRSRGNGYARTLDRPPCQGAFSNSPALFGSAKYRVPLTEAGVPSA